MANEPVRCKAWTTMVCKEYEVTTDDYIKPINERALEQTDCQLQTTAQLRLTDSRFLKEHLKALFTFPCDSRILDSESYDRLAIRDLR